MNFGRLAGAARRGGGGGRASTDRFRLAVLGDFSGRANRGEVEVGQKLASRKPIFVDVDNLDDVIKRMKLKLELPLGAASEVVNVTIGSMDDFHPDELFDNLEMFGELATLRSQLGSSSTFERAAKAMRKLLGDGAPPRRSKARSSRGSRGSAIRVGGTLDDFAALVGAKRRPRPEEAAIEDLLRAAVAPHIVPTSDPAQDEFVRAADLALGDLMCSVLHHPDFQTAESLWRSVDLLTRRVETDSTLSIILYDISAEELAADVGGADDLAETGLYKLLVEQPSLDAKIGGIAAMIGCYGFEQTPPHAELLGRLARIAAAANAPFITSLGKESVRRQKAEDVHPLVVESWGALQSMPESRHLGLTTPRFLLRHPYGRKTDPIDRFEFEEFTPQRGMRGMLWGNPAILAGLLLAETFREKGFRKMRLGSTLTVGDMPYHYYTDADGDQIPLPCTEQMVPQSLATHLVGGGLMPLLAIKGTPEVRLAGFGSYGGGDLLGPWADAAPVEETVDSDDATSSAAEESDDSDDADSSGDSSDDSSDDSGDDELAALLADLGGDDEDDSSSADDGDADDGDVDGDADDDEMDPELAALLADLD